MTGGTRVPTVVTDDDREDPSPRLEDLTLRDRVLVAFEQRPLVGAALALFLLVSVGFLYAGFREFPGLTLLLLLPILLVLAVVGALAYVAYR